jgi:hypothetical protein
MAAVVPMLMMPVAVGVLMAMGHGFVAVLMAIVAVRRRLMRVLMFMLVFVMAAHSSTLLFLLNYKALSWASQASPGRRAGPMPSYIKGRTQVSAPGGRTRRCAPKANENP